MIQFLLGMILWVFALGITTAQAEDTPPNILIIFADDLGYEAVGAYGGQSYSTPEIDRMASEGITFTRAYTSPVCTPSRVSLHTGLYTSDHGWTDVLDVHNGTATKVDFTQLPTFAQRARAEGYETSVTGKWQLATYVHHPTHLSEAGFDSWCFWQIWSGTEKTERYWDPYLNRDGNVLDNLEDKFGPDVLKDYVIEKMTEARDAGKPFLIVHNEMLPHVPIVKTPDDISAGRSASLSNMIHYMDKLTGEILAEIDALGIRDNTYVFFIGDNGTDTGATRQTVDGPVSSGKRDLTDGGTHVPFIVWGPDAIPRGSTSSDLVDITDMFPTICAIAGIQIPTDLGLRGRSILPQIEGRRGVPRHWVHQGIANKESIFDGSWRRRSDGELRDARALPLEPVVTTPGSESNRALDRIEYLFSSLLPAGSGSPTTIIDNNAATGVTFTGTWQVSTNSSQHYGSNYHHDQNSGQGSKSVSYALNVPSTQTYEIFMHWPADTNRATNCKVSIIHKNGTYETTVNQKTNGRTWVSLGNFALDAGTGTLTLSNDDADGYVIADAVGFSVPGSQVADEYLDWARAYFGADTVADTTLEASVWGASANPDGDAYANGVECGLGFNPTLTETTPAIEIRELNGSPAFYSTLRTGSLDFTVTPQVTTNLTPGTWTSLNGELEEIKRTPISAEYDEVFLAPPPDQPIETPIFFRYEMNRN
ncbi:sulfatase-like hydrolase/transferase [Kiritimatiellaeota bacterium B1221]|nr:sulfatase-like hydrolase/transferase [Kiritimatiellaeota bacterium B1221]